ncbi:hypothetical protein Tco_0648416 [Tanacetum coccineum]
MAGLLFNKFKGDMVRVLLPKWPRNSAWFKEKMLLVQAQESGQTDDLDAYEFDCDDISSAKAVLMANLSSYDLNVLSKMSEQMSNHVINWDKVNQETKTVNESLTAELERYKERVKTFKQRLNVDLSSSEKLIDLQMDDMIRNRNALKQKINSLKQTLSKQLSAEQAFWLSLSNPKSEQPDVTQTPVEIEVLKELLKVFKEEVIPFINSLRASFKDFENGHHNELNEVKTVFNQMEATVKQYVMNIVMHADSVPVNVLSNNKCLVNDNLESERLKQENDHLSVLLLSQDIVHICVNSLATLINYAKMEQDYIDEYSENLMLKAELAKKEQMEMLVYVAATCPSLSKPSEKLVAVIPLNKKKKLGMKSSTSASRSQPSGNTKNNRISQTASSNINNKVEDHFRSVKSNSNKTNYVSEPVCNSNVKHIMLNANSELICVKCNQCMFDANHDLCFLKFVNDVNVRSKSKSAKSSKKKNIWKPTSKVFTDIGYRWKLTRRTFTIVGNTFPLTRITSTKVEPLKENTSKSVTNPNPEIKIYCRKTKAAKSVDLSSKPSTVRFGNDQIAKIMGYGDYQMGNVMTSQVYYVEGLGHNLIFVGQFCDFDLEFVSGRYDAILSHLSLVKSLKDQVLVMASKVVTFKLRFYHRTGKSKKHTHKPKAEDYSRKALSNAHGPLWANKDSNSGPEHQFLTPRTISSGLVPNPPSSTPYVPSTKKDWDTLFQPMFDEYFNPPPSVASPVFVIVAPDPANSTSTPSLTINDQYAPSPSTSQTPHETQSPVIPSGVKEEFHDIEVAHLDNDPFFGVPILELNSKESSSRDVIPTNVHLVNQPPIPQKMNQVSFAG